MKAQSHIGRLETGRGKEKEREKQANERKMKAQSHTGRAETGNGKGNEREQQANERKMKAYLLNKKCQPLKEQPARFGAQKKKLRLI